MTITVQISCKGDLVALLKIKTEDLATFHDLATEYMNKVNEPDRTLKSFWTFLMERDFAATYTPISSNFEVINHFVIVTT